ncbi:MAG: hypothetical protein A2521_07000 [Deltaproteobacteria bacterium RIFOXYD12_FULL_57_12]|nr:MAG: hypothetical protein A2521_07000 [Deltaproteobacteria bacterium RIFOXYD12_FULL_57_12]
MAIAQDYIKDVDKLVPRPDIALKVLQMAHEAHSSIPQLSLQIEKDPSLTANMLRLANSAYFGHMRKINSVKDIIVRLGLETVKLLAISSASVGILNSPQEAYGLEPGELWNHSYATAVLAGVIGRHARIQEGAALYTAALLHDVGKIVLNRHLLQAALSNHEPAAAPETLQRERALLHTDHARVGQALLQKWELAEQITLPVGLHHDAAETATASLTCRIVYLANWLENTLKLHATPPAEFKLDEQVLADNLGLLSTVPRLAENLPVIIDEFFKQYEESLDLLIL